MPTFGTDDAVKVEEDDGDAYVYTNPWDTDSDKITADGTKDLSQTLNLGIDINKDGFTSAITMDVQVGEDADSLILDNAELALENDFVKGIYNSANSVAYKDYAFNSTEFNGATVEFKEYGINTFMGRKDVAVDTQAETAEKDVWKEVEGDAEDKNYSLETVDVNKYEWVDGDDEDSDPDHFELIEEDVTAPFYVMGAEKAFNFAGVDMNTVFATQRSVDADLYDTHSGYTDERRSVFGLDANTSMGILDANFDMAYSMPVDENAESDLLTRMGVSTEMDMADVEFNFRNKGENFSPLHSGGVAFDDGHDDYDKYVDGLVGVKSGYNFSVAPKLFDFVTTDFFYGSVTMADDELKDTKMSVTGETTLMGIDLTSEYTTTNVNEDEDKENTMDFGAEYTMMDEKLTATAGYTTVNPVEETDGDVESTMSFGGEFAMNDYISANASYETITNVDFGADEKATTSFGADLTDYPVFGNLTTSAGFNYETIGKDYDETTTDYNLGLGYVLGAADFNYDYTNKSKEGADVEKGTYTTNELGMTYEVVEGTDFTANYEILNFDSEVDTSDYEVKTATAGVSVSF